MIRPVKVVKVRRQIASEVKSSIFTTVYRSDLTLKFVTVRRSNASVVNLSIVTTVPRKAMAT